MSSNENDATKNIKGLGDFHTIPTVTDDNVLAKDQSPSLDAFAQALAEYDRHDVGGTYNLSKIITKE